jgi:hypothetical protein
MKATSSCLVSTLLIILLNPAESMSNAIDLPIDLAPEHEGVRVVRQLHLKGETNVSLVLRHASHDAKYEIFTRIDAVEVPPISLGSVASMAQSQGASGEGFLEALQSDMDSTVGGTTSAQWLADESNPPEEESSMETKSRIRTHDSSLRVADIAILRPGQELEVVVRRRAGSGTDEATWTCVFTTGAQGKWTVSLGFGLPILIDGDREYFTSADTSEFYTIKEEQSDETIHVTPALFFNWVPHEDELATWSWSLTAGLGYDFKNAVLFAGGSMTFHRNITFAVGAVVHQVNRLSRRYRLGQTLLEDLDPDQLVEERYAVNPFFGISFRLSEKLLGE